MPLCNISRWRGCALMLLGLLLLTGCGKPTKKIILLNNTESPYWDAARAGIKDAVKELKLADAGFDATMDNNDGTGKGQVDKLKQYATRDDVVAIGISPIDAKNEAMADQLKKLREKGVIIICFDSDLPPDKQELRDFYIGTDNVNAGKVLGTAAKVLKPDGAQYVQFVGTDTQENARQRMDGFKAALPATFEEKERKLDDSKRDVAKNNVKQVLVKYPELSLLVGIWSYNAPAIADVVKDEKAKYTVATFDAEENAITHMAQGNIDVMVVQNPFAMGYMTVQTAFAKLNKDEATVKKLFPKYGEANGNIKDTGIKVVVPATKTTLKESDFQGIEPKVEFLTLPQFQDWLKKYGLTCS
jgi:ribose transport system substrate-binding protein